MKRTEGIYYIVIGLILLAASAWTFQTGQDYMLSYEAMTQPRTCQGSQFPMDPAYLGVEGVLEAYAYYADNGTMEKLASIDYQAFIVNDPCITSTAQLIYRTPRGPNTATLQVQELPLYVIASADILGMTEKAGMVTSMGPAEAGRLELQPRISAGPVPGSYYIDVTSYYYNLDNGILAKSVSHMFRAGGEGPEYILIVQEVTDYYKSPGANEGFHSYSETVNASILYSIASGLGVLVGIASILYGSRGLL